MSALREALPPVLSARETPSTHPLSNQEHTPNTAATSRTNKGLVIAL